MALVSAASAQDAPKETADAPPLTDCDTYAASPVDPQRITEGVAPDKIDVQKAIPACEAALKQYPDLARLHFQLARAYTADKQYKEAVKHYQFAVSKKHVFAAHNLAVLSLSGLGVTKSESRAAELFKLGAEGDYGNSQLQIASMYLEGRGVTQSPSDAFKWYEKAAQKGLPDAERAIAVMYVYGTGTSQDIGKAADWYEKALLQGDEKSVANINEYRTNDPSLFSQLMISNAALAKRFAFKNPDEKTASINQGAATPTVSQSSVEGTAKAEEIRNSNIEVDEKTWTSCRSAVYAKSTYSTISAKTPAIAEGLTILQLADGTKISPQQIALISALENDVQECDKALSKILTAKAPGISAAFDTMLSKDQDSWVELVQKKIGWGDLNQKRKQHYLDYQAQKKVEIDKAQALERQRVADQEAGKQAREKLAQQARQAEDARVAQQQREEQMREQRREACLNQVTKNTVSGIFDLAGGGGGDLDLFGGAIMQGLQAGAAEAQCNRQ